MPNYFTLTLDTTGPASPTISFDSGAYATEQLQNVTISTADADTTGYQMKIWGDVDSSYDADVQGSEAASNWISFASSKQIKLSAGDGNKTIFLRIRDDVMNESAQASDTITLDTSLPVVTIVSGPDVTKISKVVSKDTCTFGWQSDVEYQAYEVRVVPDSGSPHTAGTIIGTANGSSNTSGGAGPATTTVTTVIKGADLEAASSGDGVKVIKVFVQDMAGNWSV